MRRLVAMGLLVVLTGCGGVQGAASGGAEEPATAAPTVGVSTGAPAVGETAGGGTPTSGAPATKTPGSVPRGPTPTCVPALPEQPTAELPVCEPGSGPTGEPAIVEPQPGAVDPKPLAWESAEAVGDRSTLMVAFYSGVAPCTVLDRVEVAETGETVVVTLFSGTAPGAQRKTCIAIAQYQAVEVELDGPLGDREVVDGAV